MTEAMRRLRMAEIDAKAPIEGGFIAIGRLPIPGGRRGAAILGENLTGAC